MADSSCSVSLSFEHYLDTAFSFYTAFLSCQLDDVLYLQTALPTAVSPVDGEGCEFGFSDSSAQDYEG
ncbi:MAG: hypothetical protein QNJ55_28095 [Xenococcus sp. MO_188.B8]|nr:hypothetical protein [Xenococcus sp. MO_188.B8]